VRRLAPIVALLVVAVAAGGCGGAADGGSTGTAPGPGASRPPVGAVARGCSDTDPAVSGLRATATTCAEARQVMLGWRASAACRPAAGASRSGCAARSYRCLATATDRGWSVSCAKPGRSIAFTVRRG
jgi:hypothetical protein